MKVKLLKKVRRRFTITHLPNGYVGGVYYGNHYNYNLYLLKDNENSYYERFAQLGRKPNKQYCEDSAIFNTEQDCIEHLKKDIIERLRMEGYRGRKDNQINKQHKKVWHT
jgi:hypothetical protein